MFRTGRKLVAVLAAASAVAVSLALVTIGRAGSANGTMTIFEAPINLTTGQQGLAGGKFTPSGSGSNGSATHVVITLNIPNAQPNSLVVKTCQGGTGATTSTSATCSISSIQSGATAKFFVTFRAGSTTGGTSVTGSTHWDQGGGSAGANQSADGLPAAFTIYPTDTSTNVFAGTCADGAVPVQVAFDPLTQKGGNLSTKVGAATATGLPCTPAYVGVDNTRNITGFTKGTWSVFVSPLSGGALAQAVLTLNVVPTGFNAKNMPLYEVAADNTTTRVLACDSSGLPTGGADSCLTGQDKFGSKGVQFFLNVQGSTVDPSYTG